MEFAILGPLHVGALQGGLELKAPKHRALLAMLLLSYRDDAVPSERLIDVLWGEEPPATATKALQVYVSQLRRALGPGNPIVTRPSGYAIRLEPGQLDLERFETLVVHARGAPPERAAELLREALALFRGAPLSDAPLLGPASAEADRLAGLRLAALEDRLDADLALGRHAAVVAELEALASEHPYRERFFAQLMLALYRSGRQADALDAYRRARHALVEDLGLDPGRELQRLEAAILAHDPALDLAAPAPAPAPPAPPPPAPAPHASLLGRDEDVATAVALLADADVRLLTVTGPGGIGKTRFSQELAHRLGPRFADGARFVPLGSLDDPARVVPTLAHALGATETEALNPFEALRALLAPRSMLLVIDNFEHVLDAAPEASDLIAASPGSKFVFTSRAPLHVAAEHELAIGPLAAAPAVTLYLRRARAVDPRLTLGPDDLECIERICARLDGLPLAIELAAARSKVLTPAATLDRLEHRLDLLSAGPRDAPERQQTLRAAIGWSYDLLDPSARRLFSELGVFAGGFTLKAAEAVCGVGALDGIAALADQSLVTRDAGRFGMLETVREYALEQLTDAGELDAVRRRHARAFAALTEGAESAMEGPGLPLWLQRLDADHDNLHAAIRHAAATGDSDTALAIVGAMWRYWATRGNLSEGRALTTAALAAGGGQPELLMRAFNTAGILAGEQGDFGAAREHFEKSLRLARQVGARDRIARTVGNLGNLAMYEGDYATAIRRYEEATAIVRELGDQRTLSLMTQNLGIAREGAGDHWRAIELLEESLTRARRADDPGVLTSTQRSLARVLQDDSPARALELLHESLRRSHELADRNAIVECLETASLAAGTDGDPRTGALLMGAAGALRAAAGAIRQPDEEAWAGRAREALREALGERAFAAAVAEGAGLSADDAVARALAIGREP
jgi:predicted ATPase/DNA-binding SARP family transcriptional activator